MTGPELNQLRADLGDAIGRRLSFGDMAKLCGLAPGSGADTIRKWEDGAGPSGPVAVLLELLACASKNYAPADEIVDAGKAVLDKAHPGAPSGLVARALIESLMRAEIRRRLS